MPPRQEALLALADGTVFRGRAFGALGEATLAHEVAARTTVPRDGHELVPREAAPRREILLDGGFGRADLEQAAARERVDVAPDEQEEAAAAVEVGPVEARVGRVRMAGDRLHVVAPQ